MGSASASPWAARSCASRRCSSWTSRSRTSTRSFASRCAPRSRSSSTSSTTTTIYVTHDQVEAMTMGDRVAVMSMGVLQQVDTPQQLYDEPMNLFVAGFIGTPPMNLFARNGALADNGTVSGDDRHDDASRRPVVRRPVRRRPRARRTGAPSSACAPRTSSGVRPDRTAHPRRARSSLSRRSGRASWRISISTRRQPPDRCLGAGAEDVEALGEVRQRGLVARSPTSSPTSLRGSTCASATRSRSPSIRGPALLRQADGCSASRRSVLGVVRGRDALRSPVSAEPSDGDVSRETRLRAAPSARRSRSLRRTRPWRTSASTS